jgi:hypothetical protein
MTRIVLGMITTAALAVTLAACSTSGGGATHVATTKRTSATPVATTPAASTPASAAAASSGLSGKWSGQYSGAYQGTFILNWHQSGSNLSGTLSLSAPAITPSIHGKVTGGAIRFGTVGSMAITYSGSVSGNSMSGTYQVHTPNGSVGGPWSATKSS